MRFFAVDSAAPVMGLDIGGAGIKGFWAGQPRSLRFPLWRHPELLANHLRDYFPPPTGIQCLAVTMTGELCDCFETKQHGVDAILTAVETAYPAVEIRVWTTSGIWLDPTAARRDPWRVAAANWLALAQWCARFVDAEPALVIDIGSTTTDIVPIRDRAPHPRGMTDPDRLAAGELVYVGVERTPLCALLSQVDLGGKKYMTMAEWFATTLDVFLVLGDIAEDATTADTADGRPRSVPHAVDRLARMIGSDRTRFSEDDARAMAEQARRQMVARLREGIDQVIDQALRRPPRQVVVTGQGGFLAEALLSGYHWSRSVELLDLSASIGSEISPVACAAAVSQLANGASP